MEPSGVHLLADKEVARRDAGMKRHGSTGFLLVTLAATTPPATTETFGANMVVITSSIRNSLQQGSKMHQSSGKNTAVPRVPDNKKMGSRRIQKHADGGKDK